MTAAAERVRRKVAHALFTYEGVDGLEAVGHRGAIVELLPADLARAEKFGAVIGVDDDLALPTVDTWEESARRVGLGVGAVGDFRGSLPPFPAGEGEMLQRNWVASATADEVLAEVRKAPGIVGAVMVAEQARGNPRPELMRKLARAALNSTSATPTPSTNRTMA